MAILEAVAALGRGVFSFRYPHGSTYRVGAPESDQELVLRIGFSNRFEILLDSLLHGMAATPASPLASTHVIVPSAAVRRKVELAAADRFGICANVRFSYLAQWLWQQMGQVVEVGEISPFTPPVLAWRIFQIFGDPAFVGAHPPLSAYLRNSDAVMRYDLALRTATLLDQYLTYRPDWLAAWSDDKRVSLAVANGARALDERWQAALWRRIAHEQGIDRQHPSAAFFRKVEALGGDAPLQAGLPASAHVFCLPTIPPLYLDILRRLSRWIDIDLYVLNPCREFWFDIVDPRRLRYLTVHGKAGHHDVGNRLLAAWGKQSQAQLALLFDDAGAASVDDDCFAASGGGTLLAAVQDAILDLVEIAPGSRVPLARDDRSIEIHLCHSLTRELEVLQDQLLAMFASLSSLQPSDVLVVTPDLEAAAPLIDAVFGNVAHDLRIPYTITGRARTTVNPAARALLDLLALAASRFPASAVALLLQQPIIGRRFGIDRTAFDAIHGWMQAAAIRWGIDAEHRAAFDLPSFARHSFRDGLERLYLGYALPDAMEVPLHNMLPAGNAEGSDALALGCFAHFLQQLEQLRNDVVQAATASAWMQALFGVIEAFLLPDDDEIDDLREVEAAIRELHDNMNRGNATLPIPLDLVRSALQSTLDDPARGGVPAGGVTFSAMTSLRNLPFRVVCVIGMNDGAFPTLLRPVEFDLMAQSPRLGDRQRRTDDRNVFLDLVLAARERLYLSFTGRSIRDNSLLPPSVLISDLLDYLAQAITTEGRTPADLAAARARLVVEHPLQPFAVAYFAAGGDPRMHSFNAEYCAAVEKRLAVPAVDPSGKRHRVPRRELEDDDDADDDEVPEPALAFFAVPLAALGAEWRDVTLDQLARFFCQPCRYLLLQRLGIRLPRAEEELQDDEPFVVDFRGRTALGDRLLPAFKAGRDPDVIRSLARAGTEYPPGRLGDIALERELTLLAEYAATVAADAAGPCLPPATATIAMALDGEPWRLTGGFGDLRTGGLVRARYDDVRPKDYLCGWVDHLFLNAMQPKGVTLQTIWHSRDGCYRLRPCADALVHLRALLMLYRKGLQAPLHFFPKAAWNLVFRASDSKARDAWRSTRDRPYGEDRDAAYRLALRGEPDPLDDEFVACAHTVFGPMRDVLDDPRLR